MVFHITHPIVVDLYIGALTVQLLEEEFGGKKLTTEVKVKIDIAASEYALLVREAEKILDPSIIQEQINIFNSKTGIS